MNAAAGPWRLDAPPRIMGKPILGLFRDDEEKLVMAVAWWVSYKGLTNGAPGGWFCPGVHSTLEHDGFSFVDPEAWAEIETPGMNITQRGDPLATVEVREVTTIDFSLRFHQPLRLPVSELPDSPDFVYIKDDDLNIDVIAENLEQLQNELVWEIDIVWHNYAQAADEELSPEALRLKRKWLEIAEEVMDE